MAEKLDEAIEAAAMTKARIPVKEQFAVIPALLIASALDDLKDAVKQVASKIEVSANDLNVHGYDNVASGLQAVAQAITDHGES